MLASFLGNTGVWRAELPADMIFTGGAGSDFKSLLLWPISVGGFLGGWKKLQHVYKLES